MQPDLQASLLCDDVRQERNGKFMLIGIFDGLIIDGESTVCPRMCLVNRWCSGEGEYQQKSRMMAPDGVTIVAEGKAVPIKLESSRQVATTVEVFLNLKFEHEGTHWIEVLLNQKLMIRYPLHIRRGQPRIPNPKDQ